MLGVVMMEFVEGILSNSDVVVVSLPTDCRAIGKRAFSNCRKVSAVFIPASVEAIDNSAFENCPKDLVIYGKSGSASETFAEFHGYRFVDMYSLKITALQQ